MYHYSYLWLVHSKERCSYVIILCCDQLDCRTWEAAVTSFLDTGKPANYMTNLSILISVPHSSSSQLRDTDSDREVIFFL